MPCGYQPVQSWAIIMKDGGAQSVVDGWKPARPKDSLFKGALDGGAAVEMHLHIVRVRGDALGLPERAGDKNGEQCDEESDPEAQRRSNRHFRKYTES